MANDDNEERTRSELIGALNTEYFVLQGVSSASISESSSRSSLYPLSLSSGLVSLGFVLGASAELFLPFAAAVLSVIFVLGWFTVARLIDTSVENVRSLRAMVRIRGFYAGLGPLAPTYFDVSGDEAADATTMLGVRKPSRSFIGTMASMIGAVNSVVGGCGVALLAGSAGLVLPVTVALGIVVAAGLFAGVVLSQWRRFAIEFNETTRSK